MIDEATIDIELDDSAHDLDKRLSIHEAVCAERYGQLLQRMARIEMIMIGVAGTVIAAMAALLLKIVPVLTQVQP